MIEVHADGVLVYNSRLDGCKLTGLKTTTGLNKSGTAELTMPHGHPAYNAFTSYRTVVTLRENGVLRFRGRALYPADNFYNQRTITCEGERGFLADGIIRPYLFQDSPEAIFAAALELYNASVDEFKRFTLGKVTVKDANNYIRFESESAETFAAFYDKLRERCGGYITFTDDGKGGRAINWLAEIGRKSEQPIEFGSNLLEFSRSGQSAELYTAILPYGAQLEDGTRVTIASVNGGKDWIQDDEAVQLRGRIMAVVEWDDVTEPANLLTKAKAWLAEHKLAVTTLQLTAVDLSKLDRAMDTYDVGDLVRVTSRPHSVNDWFQLTERTVDWLNAAGGNVTLGKTITTLTGADVVVGKNASAVKAEVVKTTTAQVANLATNARKVFAENAADTAITAGVVTFCNTLAVNSQLLQMDATGKMAATGSMTAVADRNQKRSIEDLPAAYLDFFDGLEPVRFKYNDGDSYHVGFIAQDVLTALEAAGLTVQDFAGYKVIGSTGMLGLTYDQFIALQHLKIKRLEERVAALEGA